MDTSPKKKKSGNDRWIKDHFRMIVDKYGGKFPYILVAGGRVFPVRAGENVPALERRIAKKYGKPVGMPVPEPQDFTSVLLIPTPKK